MYKPNQKISPLIEATELLNMLKNEDLVLIDVRSGKDAKEKYAKAHIDQALHTDLNTALSHIKENAADGGRHPLPSIEEFMRTLQELGIGEDSHVVLYDDTYGAIAATRFWWMLKAVGHTKVQVLNGGLQEAERAGVPINDTAVKPKSATQYTAKFWQLPVADIHEVEQFSEDEDHLVIDVREEGRFKGEFEPIDLIAGHIPGAINIPFATNLDEKGRFLPRNVLKKKYNKVFKQLKPENIIVHCGSGVTACHTLLAADYAGLEIPKLYVGSWSEWSRNNKRMVKELK